MLTIVATIAITIGFTVMIIAGIGYFSIVRPMQQQTYHYYSCAASLSAQLAQMKGDHRRFQTELTKWIELECRQHNATEVEKTLESRIAEYLEELEQLQQGRMERMLFLIAKNQKDSSE